jgi:hypothetical protein
VSFIELKHSTGRGKKRSGYSSAKLPLSELLQFSLS